jgi:hypothetical protein
VCVRGMSTNIRKRDTSTLQIIGGLSILQETEGQKTNNGIQYRLQLLYANGKSITHIHICFTGLRDFEPKNILTDTKIPDISMSVTHC